MGTPSPLDISLSWNTLSTSALAFPNWLDLCSRVSKEASKKCPTIATTSTPSSTRTPSLTHPSARYPTPHNHTHTTMRDHYSHLPNCTPTLYYHKPSRESHGGNSSPYCHRTWSNAT